MKYAFYPGCTLKSAAGYEDSIKTVMEALNLIIPETKDWNCCGASIYFGLDELLALTLPARVMAIAEEMEVEKIVTPCNACYATLRKVRAILVSNESLKGKVNQALAYEDKKYSGHIKVAHLIDYFLDPEIKECWKQGIKVPLSSLRVAPYFGCQYSRPQVENEDHPENPKALDHFLEALGATVVNFTAKTCCCGAAQMVPHENACIPLVKKILIDARKEAAQVVAAICPLCQLNLEAHQKKLNMEKLPIVYFTQLLGLAMGLDTKKLGLDKLLIPFSLTA